VILRRLRGHGDDRVLTGHEERAVPIHRHHDGNVLGNDHLLRAVLVLERELVAVFDCTIAVTMALVMVEPGSSPRDVTSLGIGRSLENSVQFARDNLTVGPHSAGAERRSRCNVGDFSAFMYAKVAFARARS